MSSDRFARQNRYEPPPGFPLASPSPSIVHHLSGPSICALSRILHRRSGSDDTARIAHFHYAVLLSIVKLAQMLDSLVRVSRRDVLIALLALGGSRRQTPSPSTREQGHMVSETYHPCTKSSREKGCKALVRRAKPVIPVCNNNGSLSEISGTVSLSFQSSFQLSLTVLVCYRSLASI